MKELSEYERIVLKEVLGELQFDEYNNLYSLYQKYKMSIGALLRVVDKLKEMKIIINEGDNIKLQQLTDAQFINLSKFLATPHPLLLNDKQLPKPENDQVLHLPPIVGDKLAND